ncbi:maestro heat-like repeat-containing protein family member 2B [Alligator mississippiensis]|uniref:maestro heat-like repeat-containing protein family member 2B n=1 Tax=Alligator mississippiensis TaxID=8496 RepID=UPI002877BB19|nr:maestro heat-like repeat-containing protein family member 2B [Alligator mississippiensis]
MIHPAVGEQWRVKIPILLSTIEASGNPETSQDNVWWEHLLLKFLNMTLKSIADDAWSSQLSLELQHQTASYACPSPEKVCALGSGWVSAAVWWCCGRRLQRVSLHSLRFSVLFS